MTLNAQDPRLPTWALVISTYNRPAVLGRCVQCAIEQTVPPIEIIIVDASDAWEATRDGVVAPLLERHPNIRFVYEQARVRSLACQRNQSLDNTTAEIAFLIDDDSLLLPQCAEHVLTVYAADSAKEIVAVEMATSPRPSREAGTTAPVQAAPPSKEPSPLSAFFHKKLMLTDVYEQFIPYDGEYRSWPVPPSLADLNVVPVCVMYGYRMTYRTEIIQKVNFDNEMRLYSLGEDVDASYRTSRLGGMVQARRAGVYHEKAPAGRLNRYAVCVQRTLNQALCLRKHSNDLSRDRRRFRRLVARRLLSDAIKDTVRCRWSFPQVRGTWFAYQQSHRVFRSACDDLADWFPDVILEACLPGRRNPG